MLTVNVHYVWLIYFLLLLMFIIVYRISKSRVLNFKMSLGAAYLISSIIGGVPLFFWIAHMEYLADNHAGYAFLKFGFFIAFIVLLFIIRGLNKLTRKMEDRWK